MLKQNYIYKYNYNKNQKGLLREALFLFCVLLPTSTFAISESLITGWREQVQPTLQKAGDSTSLALWTFGAASHLVVRDYDNSIRDSWHLHQNMSEQTAQWGDEYISYGINLGVAGLQYWLDQENGISHIRALAFTGLSTWSLKALIGRERPNQANHASFPSGHTSSAFATATSLTFAYGWKAGVPAYAMAVITGLSRVADDDHWASDVVAGAFLGSIWGRAAFFKKESPYVIAPWTSRGAMGLQGVIQY